MPQRRHGGEPVAGTAVGWSGRRRTAADPLAGARSWSLRNGTAFFPMVTTSPHVGRKFELDASKSPPHRTILEVKTGSAL